jgi:hypothetical protein
MPTSRSYVVYCVHQLYACLEEVVVTWMTGLMTRIKAGPIPLQKPETPSCLYIALAASIADGLIFLLFPSADGWETVTARVD